MKVWFLSVACCFCSLLAHADERLWVNAAINGRPAHLIFDTGADRLILFHKGAERLGLRVTEPSSAAASTNGEVALGETEVCEVRFLGQSMRACLGVVEMPQYLDMKADGVLGWGPLKRKVLKIDAAAGEVDFLQSAPRPTSSWIVLDLRGDSDFLSLEIPHTAGPAGVLMVDTGFNGGVALPAKAWEAWEPERTGEPATLDSYFMPGAGLVVKEETWAHAISFGPFSLTEVPLMEANKAQVAVGSTRYEGSLGLAALRRLDLVIDGPRQLAYIRPKRTPPPPYEHNRLGAVFVPDAHSDALVARVIRESPAHEAGICNGDVLLRIGDLDATKWRSDPALLPLSRFWMQPPETRLDLTLQRQTRQFKTTVMLRQILSSAGGSSQKSSQHS